jgi:P pilus assembly chaperone PapD
MKPSLWVIALTAFLCPLTAHGQGIAIAPTSVFIDARARTGLLLLMNPNDEPAEVDISTIFGYPVTDSAGGMQLYTAKRPDASAPSAASWVKVFPRRVTIPPHMQQSVRLLVSPPAGIPDGEYWSRLIITARGGKLPVTAAVDSGAVKIGLSLEVKTIIPLLYRKGKLETGVALSDLRAEVRGDSLVVRARLERRGNAAALGTVRGEVIDAAGRVRATFDSPISTYYVMRPRLTAPIDSLAPGSYRLRLAVSAVRPDLQPETVLPFRAVRDSVTVQIP